MCSTQVSSKISRFICFYLSSSSPGYYVYTDVSRPVRPGDYASLASYTIAGGATDCKVSTGVILILHFIVVGSFLFHKISKTNEYNFLNLT